MFEIEDEPEPPDEDGNQVVFIRSPSVYDRQYFISLLTSFLRFALAIVGTWFVKNGIGDQGDWDHLITGLALLIVNAISIAWSKYKGRLHFLAALSAGPLTSDEQVKSAAPLLAKATLEKRESADTGRFL